MEDLVRKIKTIPDKKVKVELYYRLNFTADKSCGYIKIFSEQSEREEEDFEIYMEHLECGLTKDQVHTKLDKVISEIHNGDLDVQF